MAGFPVRMEHPLFGMISRLDNQKGFDLIKAIMPEMMAMDLQFVLLGTGDLMYHQFFNDMIARYPDRFQAYLQFDNRHNRASIFRVQLSLRCPLPVYLSY